MPQTKIVATIGPASNDPEIIRRMLDAGMNVARINFSHGNHREHAETVTLLRQIAASAGRVLGILGDLQGPKLRIGMLPDGPMMLAIGDRIDLSSEPDEPNVLPFPHPIVIEAIEPGARLVIGDGEVELRVLDRDGQKLFCTVIVAGELGPRKGVNLPGTKLPIAGITEKDKVDLQFICDLALDFVAMSFVRSAQDIIDLRARMAETGTIIPIIAKIEKSEAIDCLLEIRDVADGMMVARGDLGIDLPAHEIPFLQKRIIKVCNEAGKPVITATQMLQSMVDHPRPTRAEASDVANAVLDGTDAVMLSAETAMGKFPVESVMTMRSIARISEKQFPYNVWDQRRRMMREHTKNTALAISSACCAIADRLDAKAIITTTMTGYTAQQVARYRPKTPIIAVSPVPQTHRRLALVWGVSSLLAPRFSNTDQMVAETIAAVSRMGFKAGDRVVITAGIPFGGAGHTNLITVHDITAEDLIG